MDKRVVIVDRGTPIKEKLREEKRKQKVSDVELCNFFGLGRTFVNGCKNSDCKKKKKVYTALVSFYLENKEN